MQDIAPDLLKKILDDFHDGIRKNSVIEKFQKLAESGKASYEEANKAAQEIGKILSSAYANNLSGDILPDGKMYYNIADRVIGESMKEDYVVIADIAEAAQTNLNAKAKIGLKAIKPSMNQDRVDGIINRISNEEHFDDIKWILDAPIQTFSKSIIDDSIKENAEFQSKAGLKTRIIRKSTGYCCKWCQEVAGTYTYPDVPDSVYRRHNNCNCTVEFDPGEGKKHQDVWSKQWKYEKNEQKIELRKELYTESKKKYMLSERVEEVKKEYIKKATPGKGSVVLNEKADAGRRKEDIETANWMVKKLGGNVEVLKEKNIKGMFTPDYLWEGEKWEAKKVSSINSIDKQLRKAAKQIGEDGRGIILDITGRKENRNRIIEEIVYRLPKRARGTTDLIIREADEIINIIRYKR